MKNKRGPNYKLAASEEKEAIALYQSGLGANSIALRFGVHPTTILRLLYRNGVKIRSGREAQILKNIHHPSRRKLTREEAESLLLRRREGESVAEIAESLGVSRQNVYHHLKRRKEA